MGGAAVGGATSRNRFPSRLPQGSPNHRPLRRGGRPEFPLQLLNGGRGSPGCALWASVARRSWEAARSRLLTFQAEFYPTDMCFRRVIAEQTAHGKFTFCTTCPSPCSRGAARGQLEATRPFLHIRMLLFAQVPFQAGTGGL